MSVVSPAPTPRRSAAASPPTPAAGPTAVEFCYHPTDGFAPLRVHSQNVVMQLPLDLLVLSLFASLVA